jgi:4,5-dihydroxyphthalate decarboxylase
MSKSKGGRKTEKPPRRKPKNPGRAASKTTHDVSITIATTEYDHVHDFSSGAVRAVGLSPTWLTLPIEEIFFRFVRYREWDVSEISMAKYVSIIANGESDLIAIPVFPSRVFRLSSIYVRSDSALREVSDLRGKKVGVPEWAQTAGVYSRGWLTDEARIPLRDIDWYQAGVNQAGRIEKVKLFLPEGVRHTSVPERTLTEMLLNGDLDAVFTAHPPTPFEEGKPGIVQMVADYRTQEEAYFRRTGIFPIMHTIAIKKEVFKRHPWVAKNLYNAFEQAKDNSVRRAMDFNASRFPLPWAPAYAREMQGIFGELFPYGIEKNLTTLKSFLRFAFEQGVCSRLVSVEELFPESVGLSYRI